MRKKISTIAALILFVGTIVYGQSENSGLQPWKPTIVSGNSDTISSSAKNKGTMALYMTPLGLHFKEGAWAFRQEIQFGTYLTDHFAWLVGIGHHISHADFKTITPAGYPTTKDMQINSLNFPLTLNYTLGNPRKMANIQLQGGITYNYVIAMKIGSDKQNLSGMDRGGFYAHLRAVLMKLFFVEYDIPFKGGDGAFYFGLSIAL